MRMILTLCLLTLLLAGCKVAQLSDQYGPVVLVENGQFKDLGSYEEYTLNYATPQDITTTNTPIARLGIPLKQVSSITVKREVKSSSQGGTIFSAIGDACIGAVKLAAGVF